MFEKNLANLSNQVLKRRLEKISPTDSRIGISYCVTPSGDYVLLKNDMPADDLNDPREAVRKTLSNNIKKEMKPNDIIIAFGLGFGYLLDELFNTYPSKIFLYEPDLNLMHFVLSNVDISEHLASGRVYITNDLDELLNKISSSFLVKDNVEIVYLQNYAVAKNKELLMLTQKVYDICRCKIVDINTITKFSKAWLMNTIRNIASVNKGSAYKLSDLEGRFENQTALIAAAGPSLNDNIAKIQANRGKFVVFAVNKAVKYLIQNGVMPDFVVYLDAENMKKTLGGTEIYLSKTNCIMDIRSDYNLMYTGFGKIFLNFSNTDFFSQKLGRYNDLKFYESGGSASTLALVAAIKMGFSKIIFAGLDLAFKDNIIYSTGETMNRISQEEILVDSVKKELVKVRSVNDSVVYTRADYEAFIHHFESLIKDYNYREVYNITSFGAYIEGMKNTAFDNLELSVSYSMQPAYAVSPFKFELKDFMQDEFKNINNIISILAQRAFSPALVSSIVKSVFVYQYMQTDILNVLQKNFELKLAGDFMEKTRTAIKIIVEALQQDGLI